MAKLIGNFANKVMPITTKKRADWTISLLEIKPNDVILEIDFGPGNNLYRISEMLEDGKIIGIESSKTNFKQAQKFNSTAIAEGKVELKLGNINTVSEYTHYFDKIFAINSIQNWDDRLKYLEIVQKALKKDGIIAITFQSFDNGTNDSDVLSFGEAIKMDCLNAGFEICKINTLKMKPIQAICVIAKNGADK